MDLISELPEDLLLRILSSLPSAKDVVATMVLSKRWKFLWMLVPKLVYDDSYQNIEYESFSRFVDRFLLLHEAPLLETVRFKLGENCRAVDIGVWTTIVVKRLVRELIIEIDSSSSSVTLPRSLFTCCTKLVTLKLSNVTLLDVLSSFSLPCLKSLSLLSVIYPGDEFVKRFLSNCHVLEDLRVEQCQDDNVTIFTVRLPALKTLSLHANFEVGLKDEDGFVIDAPSLECLEIHNYSCEFCIIENNMPKIVTASLNIDFPANILGSITSVKRLDLCLGPENVYVVGVFHSLVHLKICTCDTEWVEILTCLLRASPNLQAIRMEQCHKFCDEELPFWTEPSSVPDCVLSSLQTLWVECEGTYVEKEMVAYILRNANCLKKVTISPISLGPYNKLEMINEWSSLSRCSSACHIIFDWSWV